MDPNQIADTQYSPIPTYSRKKIILIICFTSIFSFLLGSGLTILMSKSPTSQEQVTKITQAPTPKNPVPSQIITDTHITPAETYRKACSSSSECGGFECLNGYCAYVDKDMLPSIHCENNLGCAQNEFCYNNSCRPNGYCQTDSDCQIGGRCQSPCSGNDCTYATGTCGVRTKLNHEQNEREDSMGCMAAPCIKPRLVECQLNLCVGH